MRLFQEGRWDEDGHVAELTIDLLLEDPLVRLLMASDRVDASALRALMTAIGKRISGEKTGSRA